MLFLCLLSKNFPAVKRFLDIIAHLIYNVFINKEGYEYDIFPTPTWIALIVNKVAEQYVSNTSMYFLKGL